MRLSRRNKGLQPEFTPEPTPPNSEDSSFTQNVQIETTIEENERYEREPADTAAASDDSNSKMEENLTIIQNVENDILFSSGKSTDDDDSSSEDVMIIENKKTEKNSSTLRILCYGLL